MFSLTPGEQIGAEAASQMGTPDVAVDRDGRAFDPALHSVGRDGKPIRTKSGFLRARRGSQSTVAPQPQAELSLSPQVSEARQTGIAASQLFFMLTSMYGGPEWSPNRQEAEAMASSMGNVMEYYGVEQIHPVVALVAVMAAYAQPRLVKSDVRSKLKGWWYRMRHRRESAFADNRNNGLREDYTGNSNVGGLPTGRSEDDNS